MIYRLGQRYTITELRVVSVTTYVATIHSEHQVLKFRYTFRQDRTGLRFVYTGVQLFIKEGDVIAVRGTVKREPDKYGFIRLSRVRKVEIEQGSLGI